MIMNERGFTVMEVLAASAVIGIALMSLLTVVPLGSYGVQEGKQLSTASFLADQRLEQVRNAPWTVNPLPNGNDCLGISASATATPTVPAGTTCTLGAGAQGPGTVTFSDESAAQITGFPGYSRTVRVTDCNAVGGCTGVTDPKARLVTVTVTYTPMSGASVTATQKAAVLSMLVAKR